MRIVPPMLPFMLLFGLLYAAFGAASPFLPALMEARGLSSEQIGLLFGSATAVRLLSAPVAGRIADATGALRATLAFFCLATALSALGYLSASGFWLLLGIGLVHAIALAPTTNVADALAVIAARRQGFEYGWVRGAGSAAFIVASVLAGAAVSKRRGVRVHPVATTSVAARASPSASVSSDRYCRRRRGSSSGAR